MRLKNGECNLKRVYNDYTRSVRRDSGAALRNNDIRVVNQAKSDPKGLFMMYRTRAMKRKGDLKTGTGKRIIYR